MKIVTRAGHIGDVDNRFLGRSVFTELVHEVKAASDSLGLALGIDALDDDDRDALRLAALATTSPDARVWPVKLTRLLSSYGDPVAGYYGAQLVCAGTIMGPGTAATCAAGLVFVAASADTDEGLEAAVAEWCARAEGRFGGFGVPFRPEDERMIALRRLVAGTPLAERPFWRLHERVVAVMVRQRGVQPNVAVGVTALLLDAGVPPARCGVALATLMAPVFLAHALEAATTDRGVVNAIPAARIDYAGVGPRRVGDETPVEVHPALRRHVVESGGDAYTAASRRE